MTPVLNQILFKPFPPKETSANGLFIPESCRVARDKGTIVKVGRGTAKKPMCLKEGMIAHRVKNWGTEIVIDSEQYFLMEQDAILAIE
jgi:co-chaperonin GroES (HSP10)